MTANGSQAVSGTFSQTDLPDFQTAAAFVNGHWRRCLSEGAYQIVWFVMQTTAQFQRQTRRIRKKRFFKGFEPNHEKSFYGIDPIDYMSDPSFYRALNEAVECGVIVDHGDHTYSLNYSVTALDLVQHESVIKRIKSRYRRGGVLSTIEGIIAWATAQTERLIAAVRKPSGTPTPKQPSTRTQQGFQRLHNGVAGITATARFYLQRRLKTYAGKDLGYTLTYENKPTSFDKSQEVEHVTRELDMPKPSDLLQSINAQVDAKRSALHAKRKKRGTLADLTSLFATQWDKGARDRDRSFPVPPLTRTDRALVKDRIIKPFRDSDMDIEAFAYWCARHWEAIGAQYFTKSKKYPERPAIRWLIAVIDKYIEAFANREYLDETGKMKNSRMVAAEKAEAAISQMGDKFENATKAQRDEMKALRAELRKLRSENYELREEAGKPLDDDPDLAKGIATVRKDSKRALPSWDETDPENKPKIKRKRKIRK